MSPQLFLLSSSSFISQGVWKVLKYVKKCEKNGEIFFVSTWHLFLFLVSPGHFEIGQQLVHIHTHLLLLFPLFVCVKCPKISIFGTKTQYKYKQASLLSSGKCLCSTGGHFSNSKKQAAMSIVNHQNWMHSRNSVPFCTTICIGWKEGDGCCSTGSGC